MPPEHSPAEPPTRPGEAALGPPPGGDPGQAAPPGGEIGLHALPGGEAAPPSSAALLHRIALGDEDAFSRLYDEVAPMLFALIRRVVRDVAMSEEVMQEVFVEIWRQATRFDAHRGSAQGWLCTIAHRRAVDTVRSSEAARRRDSEEGLLQLEQQVVDVQEEGIMRVESRRVRTALGELTSAQSEAIRLAYFGGYSHREVAALLDIPVGTAKTRIRDGMIVLRDRLGVTS
ncbi:ECF RNA polymerase sigma factor SigK [Brachybacterium saurashtrense]|uniref:RNA polymerase subunit sigma n=1 Tax=Brachybacterium saurashtrense TaxID=556288 RepID=A0A345YRR7_9MICO|nr:ECF RNA polymerase sigma factor SigK [Brachybacterium saurashtrense]AXK46619.1 RNA polymerase subunit sigma [Brachybacterium saurashtrense]RRR20753.1 RNA polymerase subunit sigma [Brachybacterium saurashtrense]RRR24360.1 RNA polymerase subunit sigma [Brachybacterium saurashtrense]